MNSDQPPPANAAVPANVPEENPALKLAPLEARVLGCLIEKELTTPDIYPLTLNALVNAANQRNNRAPLLAATHEDIEHALDGLRDKRLVTRFDGAEARVAKYRHGIAHIYTIEHVSIALLAELLLRGPQTTAELRTRAERMAPKAMPANLADVEQLLADLASRAEGPLTRKLPRQPGQKEARWTQLLTGEPTAAELASDAPVPVTVTQTLPPEVERRLMALETEVTRLRDELDALQDSLS